MNSGFQQLQEKMNKKINEVVRTDEENQTAVKESESRSE